MSLPEEIMTEVMKMTDALKHEALDYAKVLRLNDARDTTALMESVVAENREAFMELAK